ncbi:UDP-4-amino-4,6-dideoxy-N-acetyl-beta-L-altrosamine N-acetyltransferase [Govanella unica]|uniref:UDP-4-amino-4, 6-dideoxy-N-acetyl-beta-L-altrosamine N-acetyltransferase n=1 Tax=Govanella unica TaxID=2975056 RepID=A0A9X3TZM0_9PROT|nr:UDP-4-amino-4,6-dideoxy-N-acetyl-beta-L-altrosamine N-acetyltransferase [Govania unica]MDA5194713.1 UDP-4-amino-4,6-dideoxy-N-acetyl-beta-L-altrosamine N-acetyltransferase [Govania unica]
MIKFREQDFRLRPLRETDLDLVRGWRNADRVRLNMYRTHIIGEAEHRSWFARLDGSVSDRAFVFEMQDRPVGFVSFTQISAEHRRAFWAFYLGDAELPRGTGAVMECLALDHGFLTLGLHKLSCEVIAFNAAVIKMHKRFGFAEEGIFRDEILRDGQYHDVHRLALMADDWRAGRMQHRAALFQETVQV